MSSKNAKGQMRFVKRTTNVVVQRQGRKRPKQKRTFIGPLNRPKPPRSPLEMYIRQYALALRDPFDPRVDGVRLLDSYRYATTTLKYKTRIVLTSDASGILSFTVLPCPMFSLQMVNGTQSGLTQFTQNSNVSYLTSPATMMNSGYGAYRVVGFGFRLLLSDTLTSAKGIYTVAPVPIPYNSLLDFNMLDGYARQPSTQFTDVMGLPEPSSAIEVLPHARTFNANDLQYQGDFMGVGVPYDSTCKDFRPLPSDVKTAYSTNGTFNGHQLGNVVLSTASLPSTMAAVGSNKTLDMVGNICFVVYGSGLPISTSELSLELVYHVELVLNPIASVIGAQNCQAAPQGSTALLEGAYNSVKDNFYLGRKAIDLGLNLGMLGVKYANTKRNSRLAVY
jgi:hypothetical protein